jgi:AraC-like DNA-binding protein/ligand-binding sensor protein
MNLRLHGKPFQAPEANGQKEVFTALAESDIYHDFANNFRRATGLPVSLTPAQFWRLAHNGQPRENPFCALLAQHSPACTACLEAQHKVAQLAAQSAQTIECVHGLCETAVPVRAGEQLLGFVRTGQVFLRAPTRKEFERVLKRLAGWGEKFDFVKLREAYFATRVMAPTQYYSSVGLLRFLARELAMLSNQIVLQQVHNENPIITGAKKFIEANYHAEITLRQVADAAHLSPSYFCKLFKLGTGINFNCYVSRLRVEKAKYLLLNPQFRVTEIGFGVGFGSLTHFNRSFKEIAGSSPTAYRAQLDSRRNARPLKPANQPKASAASPATVSRVSLLTSENRKLLAVDTRIAGHGPLEHGAWPALSSRLPFGPATSQIQQRGQEKVH